jgi:hypothetical protein
MTKACTTEQEAQERIDWYKNNDKRYTDPTYRKATNGEYWVVFDGVTSKILKSINFESPDLKKVIFSEEHV